MRRPVVNFIFPEPAVPRMRPSLLLVTTAKPASTKERADFITAQPPISPSHFSVISISCWRVPWFICKVQRQVPMRIVAISNQKGGVGKTTTALNLAACLTQRGVRVLLVDLDPQANATSGLGLAQEDGGSLYSALVDGTDPRLAIRSTRLPNLSIIRSHQELAGCEIELAQAGNHMARLKEVLAPLRASGHFDYAILDTPPSLGVLMTGALAAADELLVPIQCEYFGLEGLSKIVNVVQQIRECGANPNLLLEGIVMTMYDSRANLANQVVNDVRNYFAETCYQTLIPRTVRLGEAPSFGKSIIEYEPSGRGAQAYRALANEFLARRGVPQAPVAVTAA